LLIFVPTPIGNIADISLRTLEVLSTAEVFLCEDTRVTKQLLKILQERYSLELQDHRTFYSLHSHNEDEFVAKLTPDYFDKVVVYMSDAGMPCVSDPGSRLVAYMQKNSLNYEILPGANAVLSAYAASGFSSSRFLFFGFLPHKGSERSGALAKALYSGYVTILYEAPHRLLRLLYALEKEEPKRELFLAKELTKRYQKFYKGTASEILQELPTQVKGEWVVVIQNGNESSKESCITPKDIDELDIPKKQKAKLLAKITGKTVKEIYNTMVS